MLQINPLEYNKGKLRFHDLGIRATGDPHKSDLSDRFVNYCYVVQPHSLKGKRTIIHSSKSKLTMTEIVSHTHKQGTRHKTVTTYYNNYEESRDK